MKWVEVRQNRWATEDGRYEIDGAVECNVLGPRRWYEGRRTRKHAEGPHLVCHNVKTLAEAQAHCEAHDRE